MLSKLLSLVTVGVVTVLLGWPETCNVVQRTQINYQVFWQCGVIFLLGTGMASVQRTSFCMARALAPCPLWTWHHDMSVQPWCCTHPWPPAWEWPSQTPRRPTALMPSQSEWIVVLVGDLCIQRRLWFWSSILVWSFDFEKHNEVVWGGFGLTLPVWVLCALGLIMGKLH